MSAVTRNDIHFRRAQDGDHVGIVSLLRESLGKQDFKGYEEFLDWKHRQNPFGESPEWVAIHDGQVVGFRTFMRWEFLDDDGQVLRAVRAVDTATSPAYRGLGIFRDLTLRAVEELAAEGVKFVFNTPNDQSRPGYLKMGWNEVGRLPVGVLPAGPRGLARMARARVPANLWSEPTDFGLNAGRALADPTVARALVRHAPTTGLRTHRTPEYMAWRFSLEPLHYRLVLVDESDLRRGGLVIRLRKRGAATEAVIAEPLIPDQRGLRRSARRALEDSAADYALALRSGAAKTLPALPRQGPTLTARYLAGTPQGPGWDLTMADVELM